MVLSFMNMKNFNLSVSIICLWLFQLSNCAKQVNSTDGCNELGGGCDSSLVPPTISENDNETTSTEVTTIGLPLNNTGNASICSGDDCSIQKNASVIIGSDCGSEALCNSISHSTCKEGICECIENYVRSYDSSECLAVAVKQGDSCQIDKQCDGIRSECKNGKCALSSGENEKLRNEESSSTKGKGQLQRVETGDPVGGSASITIPIIFVMVFSNLLLNLV